MRVFIPTRHHNPCQICGNTNGDCRQVEELHLCIKSTDGIAPEGFQFIGLSSNHTWGKFRVKQDQEWTPEQRQQWQEKQARERQAREQAEAARQLASFSPEKRDRYYRKLQGQLTLESQDRADLHRRGLTDEQIKTIGFKSVVQWQRLETELPSGLPGVNIDGRSLNTPSDGYLCPIVDIDQKLVGYQIRLKNSQDTKYLWLTSRTQKRDNGPTPNLPNGELPIVVARPLNGVKLKSIGLAEGILKPWIAAQRLGQVIIGAAGGQFAGSPDELKRSLEKLSAELGTKTVTLYPDAGAVENQTVMLQYHLAFNLLEEWGYNVQVAWWDQLTKGLPDIDELDQTAQIRLIPSNKLLSLAIDRGYQPPKFDHSGRSTLNKYHGLGLLKRVEKLFRKERPRLKRQQPEAPVKRDNRVIQFEKGQRLETIQALKAQGYKYFLDITPPGYGKSHNTASYYPEDLGVTQLFLLSDDHRNPTTSPAEEWADLPTRHNGLVRDESRQTQSGKVYQTRPKPGVTPDIPGNCINADRFHILSSKGINADRKVIEGETGTLLNPICAGCSFVGLCGQGSGNGYGFRNERARGLSQTRTRGHIDSLSTSDIQVRAAAIVDEASRHLKPTQQLEADFNDWSKIWMEVENKAPNAYRRLEHVRRVLYPGITEQATRYGWTHPDIKEALGEAPADIYEIIQAIEAIAPKPQDLIGERERLNIETMTSQQKARLKVLGARVGEFKSVEAAYQALQVKYGAVDAAKRLGQLSNDEIKLCQTWSRHYADGKIEDLRAELRELQQLKKRIDGQRKVLKNAQASLNRQQWRDENEAINNLPTYWLAPLLRIWAGEPGTIRIAHNRLTITLPNTRMQETIQAFDTVILLDATAKREYLALALGVSPDEIAVIEQVTEQPTNLKIYQVSGFGLLNTQRSADQNRRVTAAKEALRAKHPDIAILDWMRCDDRDGYWFRDNRGTNHFENVSAIAAFGTPYSNIGSLEDEMHALTGEWDNAAVTEWANWLAIAEIIQAYGRLRAHRRPGEELAFYIFTGLQLSPELNVIQLTPSDISPECGTRGDITRQMLIDSVQELMSQGGRVTQEAVATAIGKARSWVAELSKEIGGSWRGFLKIVGTLLESSNRTSDNSLPDQYEEWIALEHLPTVTEDKPPEDIPREVREVISTVGWDSWVRIAALLPYETRVNLLSGLLNLLPRDWLLSQLEAIGGD